MPLIQSGQVKGQLKFNAKIRNTTTHTKEKKKTIVKAISHLHEQAGPILHPYKLLGQVQVQGGPSGHNPRLHGLDLGQAVENSICNVSDVNWMNDDQGCSGRWRKKCYNCQETQSDCLGGTDHGRQVKKIIARASWEDQEAMWKSVYLIR